MNASEQLQQLLRQHDAEPAACAKALRRLLVDAVLPPDDLPSASWLVNHLIGEIRGDWAAAWALLQGLPRDTGQARLLRNMAVAASLAGQVTEAWALERQVAAVQAQPLTLVRQMLRFACLQHLVASLGPLAAAQALLGLLAELDASVSSSLDPALAGVLNNIVSTLLEHPALEPANADCAQALRAGVAQAKRVWQGAGNWVNHERACYLQALVANRLGEAAAAQLAAEEGLALIATHGTEDVDQAFLLLELARAQQAQGQACQALLQRAEALAAAFDEPGLRDWFASKAQGLPAMA